MTGVPVIPLDEDVERVAPVSATKDSATLTGNDASPALGVVDERMHTITGAVFGIARTVDGRAAEGDDVGAVDPPARCCT